MTDKLEKLHNFLRGNVISPSTPKLITLSDFKFDPKDMSGSFSLTLENVKFLSRFKFSVEIDGRYQISPPLYVSPIGVPSSYPSIELTDETSKLIEKLINDFFPKVKPLGIDEMTEKFISRDTPMVDRLIDKDYLDWFIDEIERDGFQLKLKN
ncbi:hypothetical protein M2131_001546 [Polynucleobacter sphagniphilus]|uniref:hypothetical protein n=1 Tax=Polynucleobacter sphagniphilus TaxID=1743169 RepID=UPI002474AB16|nr:hypothetical protein [Polynucleobacter sphagniphilus]MDH6421605.1 hypothetical protein [Polynucleobacter sphagniphilus]